MDKFVVYTDENGIVLDDAILIKVTKMEYIPSLLDGKLYMSTLSKFRKMDQDGVGDDQEGLLGIMPSGIMQYNDMDIADVKDVHVYLNNHPVFCTLAVPLKKVSEDIQEFCLEKKYLEEFMFEKDAKYGMLVFHKDSLKQRLDEVFNQEGICGYFEKVNYSDDTSFPEKGEEWTAAFRKRTRFQHQHEYRLFLSHEIEGDSCVIDIGDVRDFAWAFPIPDVDAEIKIGMDFSKIKALKC